MNPAPPKMHYVYLLKDDNNKFYIGCTSNLERRLEEHSIGKCYTTKKHLPVDLVYYEAYVSKDDAYDREKRLKQYGSSLQKLKQRLKRSANGGAG